MITFCPIFCADALRPLRITSPALRCPALPCARARHSYEQIDGDLPKFLWVPPRPTHAHALPRKVRRRQVSGCLSPHAIGVPLKRFVAEQHALQTGHGTLAAFLATKTKQELDLNAFLQV